MNFKSCGKKGLFIALGVTVVIVAIVALAFPFVKNTLSKTFLPAESYYHCVEKNAIEESIDVVAEYLDNAKKTAENQNNIFEMKEPIKVDTTLSLTFGDGIINAITDNAGIDLSFLKNIGIGAGIAIDENKLGFILSLILENQDLLTANAVIDGESYTAYASLPQLTDTEIKLDLEKLTGMSAEEMMQELNESLQNGINIYEALPEGRVLKSVAMRYVGLILAELDEVEKENGKISVYDIEAGCTALTVTVREKTLKSIIASLFNEIKDDDELWGIIEEIAKASGTNALEKVMSARDALNEYFEEIKDELTQAVEGVGELKYTVFVNTKGKVIERKIIIEPSKAVSTLLTSIIADFENDKGINLDALGISLDEPSAVLDFELSETEAWLNLGVLSEGKALVDLKIDTIVSEASALEIPSDAIKVEDETDLANWASTFDLLGFIDSLPDGISGIVYIILMSALG